MSDANGRCRACLEPVIWARTEPRNRWFALDPKPDPGGNQAAWKDSDDTWRTRQLGGSAEPLWGFEAVYMPHVATCEKRQPKPQPPPPPENVIAISPARWRQGAKPNRRSKA